MVPLCKSSCSNLQASEITLYILRATYWKETQNMPLFSPNLFSFLNILTDKVKVFWTHLYRQTGYSSMFISGPTCNRSTQYTPHILSLPSNKLTYSPRRQNGLQTTNIFTKTLVQTKDGSVWAINQYKGCLCGPATNMDERCTVGMSANSLHRQFVSTLARPASLSSPAKENGPISREVLQVYLFCILITLQKPVNSWRTSPEKNYSGVAI